MLNIDIIKGCFGYYLNYSSFMYLERSRDWEGDLGCGMNEIESIDGIEFDV